MNKELVLKNLKEVYETAQSFVLKHKEEFAIATLLIACYCLYFCSMGHYPLIDVDETRYVAMSRDMVHTKDFLTLYLNGDFFFEKPPLYFWLESLSFLIFGHVSEAVARIPVALTATLGVFLVYALGRKIASKKYGFISALILASSMEYIMLSRVAILDMLLSVCIAVATFSGVYTLFSSENNKKYFWWVAYLFAGLAVMAKGIPGLAIPALTILLAYVTARKWRELYKPLYMVPGIVLFLLVSLPWHIAMLQMHGHLFFHEYIYKHHIERFVNSHELGRKEPFFYFIPVFFIGFMPWIFSFVAQIVVYCKKHFKDTLDYFKKFNDLQPLNQFIVLNVIYFAVVFLFFSSASTKLPTYILPAMFPASLILGKFWFDYLYKDENNNEVNTSTLIMNFIFIAGILGLALAPLFMKPYEAAGMMKLQVPGIVLLGAFVSANLYAILKDKKVLHFASLVAFMALLSMFAARFIFPFMVSFGENELIEYANLANRRHKQLGSICFGNRYSLIYYRNAKVNMYGDIDLKGVELPNMMYVVVKNKNLDKFNETYFYDVIKEGHKYSLFTNIVRKDIIKPQVPEENDKVKKEN